MGWRDWFAMNRKPDLSPATDIDKITLTGFSNLASAPGQDPYQEGTVQYRLPSGVPGPDIDASVGGGSGMQALNVRHLLTTGGGDTAFYNVGLSCFRLFHYGERNLPGRRYPAYEPVLGFSEWLR